MEATKSCAGKQALFVGIDVHKKTYHVTGIDGNGLELFSTGMPADKEVLLTFLRKYGIERVKAVYEAGYFGYDLHDTLLENGAFCLVTPPSLVPAAYGNRVKTDRRDSRKLSLFLSWFSMKWNFQVQKLDTDRGDFQSPFRQDIPEAVKARPFGCFAALTGRT